MQDLSNLSFNVPTTLPSPNEAGGNVSGSGQTSGGSAASRTTATGGATAGVNASKGASTATGVNSLVIDQSVAQSTATASGISGMGMDAASILGAAPSIDPQSMSASLGKVADDIEQIGGVLGAIASDVSGIAGFTSIGGRMKEDAGTKAERGDLRDGEKQTEGKGKGQKTAEGSSPSSEDGVSRSVSPTGGVTTTVSTQSNSTSGAATTSTTTTTTSDSSSSSSQATTTSTTSGMPPEAIDMEEVMDEIGSLEAQESDTMAQQQTSEIDAINAEAEDTNQQADQMMQGASMMMTMATVGVAVSVAGAAYQTKGVGDASQAGDEAHMASLDEGNEQLQNSMTKSSDETGLAIREPSRENISAAQRSISESKLSVKTQLSKGAISEDQAASMNKQLDAQSSAVTYAQYKPTGIRDLKQKPEGTDAYNNQLAADKLPSNTKPEEAADFYHGQAKAAAATRSQGISFNNLAKQGIRPGQTVSKEDARRALGGGNHADKDVQAFQAHVKNLSTNRNSGAWQQGFNNAAHHLQTHAAMTQSLSGLFGQGLANMEDQQHQAAATKESASAQVQSSVVQSMQAGISQTNDLASQFRQAQSSVASAMLAMVQATAAA